MSGGRRIDGADLTLGALALIGAGGYLYETAQIPASLLEDAVGARGVPLAIGWAMAALGALLCCRAFVRPSRAQDALRASEPSTRPLGPHARALGLLAILFVYVVVLPYAGYIAATAMLIASVAWFSGAPRSRYLPVIGIAGGVFLWVVFDPMLSVALPVGSWWEGR